MIQQIKLNDKTSPSLDMRKTDMTEAIGIILLAAGTYLCGWLKGKGIG